MIMKDKYFEYIGWLGFVLIVSAYLFLTIKMLVVNSVVYQLMNLVGASCMVANARNAGAKPFFWLNITWALVAVVGLVQLIWPYAG